MVDQQPPYYMHKQHCILKNHYFHLDVSFPDNVCKSFMEWLNTPYTYLLQAYKICAQFVCLISLHFPRCYVHSTLDRNV